LYAERVIDFCRAARLLTGAILHLRRSDHPKVSNPEVARDQALQAINMLRRSVTSVIDLDENENLVTFWESPSLLASFTEMYVQDLLFGRPALTCTCCGAPFVSSAYQARYCSVGCRRRGQKRRVRQQKREAIALHAAGNTEQEIADLLGKTTKVVAQWLTTS
jgi:hypothetical protein